MDSFNIFIILCVLKFTNEPDKRLQLLFNVYYIISMNVLPIMLPLVVKVGLSEKLFAAMPPEVQEKGFHYMMFTLFYLWLSSWVNMYWTYQNVKSIYYNNYIGNN